MIVVSDSTPLIHFAKIGYIHLLFSLYNEILITDEVYRETVEEGIILEKEDAKIIRRYIGKNIHIKNPMKASGGLVEKYQIHKGEADSIQLAKEVGAPFILMNERDGRIAAKNEGINVKGSLGVLFEALKAELINKNEALIILKRFKDEPHVFWIEPGIIKAAMEKIHLNNL